jgi:hypothetical protein
MDSDIIREEIDRTVRRIDEDLQRLAERTQRATRTAARWMAVAATAAAALTVIAIWRYRSSRKRRIAAGSERPAVPLRSVTGESGRGLRVGG